MVPAAFVGDDRSTSWHRCSSAATRSSTAATRGTATTSTGPGRSPRDRGIDYVDVGVSGGVHGLERGYCLMVGGAAAAVERLTPIFDALAPGVEAAERTPTRAAGDDTPSSVEHGWLHCGPSGAGHFVKMVHNGIEYGLMAAYAEGLNVLAKANIGAEDHVEDAETAPLPHPRVLPLRLRPRRRSPRCGAAAAWSPAGCSTSPPRRSPPTPSSTASPATCRTPARVAGRSTRRSTRACPSRCWRRRCSSGSARVAAPTSPTRCCRRCAPASADTSSGQETTR